jgi:hypothetical protein
MSDGVRVVTCVVAVRCRQRNEAQSISTEAMQGGPIIGF